ncbi:MAG: hypothetical protein SGJ27_01565 [Candidatus Melainabacteria bacterium]|nr:hypothetical protein [Candidatus Melainabacteria bacterium]
MILKSYLRLSVSTAAIFCFILSSAFDTSAQTPGKAGTQTRTMSGSSSTSQKSVRPENVIRDAAVTVKTNTRPITIEGEVVDTWCYTSGVMGDGRGESHKSCARKCVGGGVTAGILADDGTLYIAAKHKAYNGCAGLLLPFVASRVKVQGWLAEKGGVKLLKINTVEKVSKSASAATPASKTSTRRP